MIPPPPRPLKPEEWPLLQELLRVVHRRSTRHSYTDEYPLMLHPGRSDWLIVIPAPDGRSLLAHVGALERELRLGSRRLPVALVGSVATHPAARGQGLASRALAAVHALLRQRGMVAAFLWSEDRKLYRDAGYHPVGRSLLFQVAATPPSAGLRCRAIGPEDDAQLLPLLERRSGALGRSPDEHRRLTAIPGVEGFVAERSGAVVAWLYVGKGSDLRDIGHDWAGDPEAVLELASWVLDWRGGPLGLLTPDLPDPVALGASAQGWSRLELPVAQAVVFDPDPLLEAACALAGGPGDQATEAARANHTVAAPGSRSELQDGALSVWTGSREERDEDPGMDALPLEQRLFGVPPGPDREAGRLHDPGPPLPFYIWGLDSM